MKSSLQPVGFKYRQGGAALFTSLMILIILTVLALAASKVTSLQERMAGVYLADNRAFLAAEDRLRDTERSIVNDDPIKCDARPLVDGPPANWVTGTSTVAGSTYENLNNATSPSSAGIEIRGSRRVGQSRIPGSVNCLVFRVSSRDYDNSTSKSSVAFVQSTYTP